MSFYPLQPKFAAILRSFGSAEGLPFCDVLTEEDIQQACKEEGVSFGQGTDDVYTPAVTLWAFLTQCLSASKSCVAAVARVLVLRVALGLPPCAAGNGAYCKARFRASPKRCCESSRSRPAMARRTRHPTNGAGRTGG